MLSHFAPLFEMAASLNLIYVAADFSRNYTKELLLKVFNIDAKIEAVFQDCERFKSKEETLNALSSVHINGKDRTEDLENTKKQFPIFKIELKKIKDELKSQFEASCKLISVNMAPLCLYLFFFTISILLIDGLGVDYIAFQTQYILLFSLSFFTLLYLLIGWFLDLASKKYFNVYKLSASILIFVFVLISSVAFADNIAWFCTKSSLYGVLSYKALVLLVVAIPYLNFIVYFIVVFIKHRLMTICTKKRKKKFMKDNESFVNQVENYIKLKDLEEKLS